MIPRDAAGVPQPGLIADAPDASSLLKHLPKLQLKIPAVLRSQVELQDMVSTWWVRPRGWHDYTDLDYVPANVEGEALAGPHGPADGWIILLSEDDYSARGEVAGSRPIPNLIPDADSLIMNGLQPMPAKGAFVPRLDSVSYSNRCTTLVTYRMGRLVVKGYAYAPLRLTPSAHGPAYWSGNVREAFVALPARDAKLQTFLLGTFMARRIPRPAACH